MKKKFILLLFLSVGSLAAMACDICGSGAGGGYLGLLPGFRKKFISLRYLQNGLVSHLGPGGSYTYLTTTETFHVAELWGAVNIGNRFRVAGFVPFNTMERSNGTGHFQQSGLGDMTFIGYYQLLNKSQTTTGDKLLVQSLWVGTGVKVPTGRYNPEEKSITESTQNTFQLGTGSVDFSLHAMYDIRLQDAGINLNAGYKMNTANKFDYRYGNKLTLNMLAYYKLRFGRLLSMAPNAGMLFESAAKDHRSSDLEVWETGGQSLMGTVGFESGFGRLGLGANFQAPLSQHLGEGKVKAKDRGMIYLSFSF